MAARGLEHGASFTMVHGHARFAENVLSSLERSDGHGGMRVRPCADTDGSDSGVVEERLPMVMNVRNGKLLGDPLARCSRPVGDSDDLDVVLLCQTRNMKGSGVGAGSDQADADLPFRHEASLSVDDVDQSIAGSSRPASLPLRQRWCCKAPRHSMHKSLATVQ